MCRFANDETYFAGVDANNKRVRCPRKNIFIAASVFFSKFILFVHGSDIQIIKADT
jgi:hypothetical protein